MVLHFIFLNAFVFPSPTSEPVYKSSCVLTVHAISHYSPDVLKGHAGVALPLAFLGMHQAPGPDEDKEKSHDATLWAEVWQENVPGMGPNKERAFKKGPVQIRVNVFSNISGPLCHR